MGLPQFKASGLAVVYDHARSPHLLSAEPFNLQRLNYDTASTVVKNPRACEKKEKKEIQDVQSIELFFLYFLFLNPLECGSQFVV